MSVTLHTTHGDIKLELHCTVVPRPAFNFLALCARHSFDNVPFHRVVRDYMIQSGDPTGLGTVSDAAIGTFSKKSKKWKRLPDQIVADLTFDEGNGGVVAFANGGGGKPSNRGIGSQFFITCAKAPHLNGSCTIVGRVIHGMDVVNGIAHVEVDQQYRPVGRNKDDNSETDGASKMKKKKNGDGDDDDDDKESKEEEREEDTFAGMPKIISVTLHANPFATGLVDLPAD